MIKKPFPASKRPQMRIDKLRPAAQPGWYKHFRRLAAAAGINFKVK